MMTRDEAISAMRRGYTVRHECWAPGWFLWGMKLTLDQWSRSVDMPSLKDGWEVVR